MNPVSNGKPYALITGASSGIGYELARFAAGDGYNLILVARTEDLLKSLADELKGIWPIEIHIIIKDLFKPGAAKEVYDETAGMGLQVDILINDAGQGEWGPFVSTDLDREIGLVHLNIIAVMSLTKYYLKDMVIRGHGRILQLASSLAKTPTPLMSVYAATKAFVLSHSEALAKELRETGVTITALQPYATDTDFFHKAKAEETDMYKTGSFSDPKEVAKAGYDGMLEGKVTVVPGVINKLTTAMNVLSPDSLITKNLHSMMKPSDKIDGRNHTRHEASASARNKIMAKTGRVHGDYENHHRYVYGNNGTERDRALL